MAQLQQRIDNAGGTLPVYIGEAVCASSLQSLKWRIQKLTYSGTDVIRISWANGTDRFDKRWDNRATYTYI